MSIALSEIRDTHICLTFNEANIIMENIKDLSKNALMVRLKELGDNAADPLLKSNARTLLWKIGQLSDKDYSRLRDAASRQELLFPPNFPLTYKPEHINETACKENP